MNSLKDRIRQADERARAARDNGAGRLEQESLDRDAQAARLEYNLAVDERIEARLAAHDGDTWGECPYCGRTGWLGYKDHCEECATV